MSRRWLPFMLTVAAEAALVSWGILSLHRGNADACALLMFLAVLCGGAALMVVPEREW